MQEKGHTVLGEHSAFLIEMAGTSPAMTVDVIA
jgi:hypothetical protein